MSRRLTGRVFSSTQARDEAVRVDKEIHRLKVAGWEVTKVPDMALFRATRGDSSFVFGRTGRVFEGTAKGARTGERAPREIEGNGMFASEYAAKLAMENAGVTHT
jgi:hypothetical protein